MSAISLAARISALPRAHVSGAWQRHVAARHASRALEGHTSDARWGTADGFAILYLGRPIDSVTVEAYRHYVDPLDFETADDRSAYIAAIGPRVLVTCTVSVSQLLDLRSLAVRGATDLTLSDLRSKANDPEAYGRCRTVAQVAHQLGYHGVLAPAATAVGETLALFTNRLPAEELPTRSADDVTWSHLPSDPREEPARVLRIVSDDR